MIYIALEHARRNSYCPVSNQQHGPARSHWAALVDGAQLADEVVERDYAELAELLKELRSLPGDPPDVAVVVDPTFANGACQINPHSSDLSCFEAPSCRRLEISTRVPHRDGSPIIVTQCGRCLSKHFPDIDQILHRFCGTSLPEEPKPEPEPPKSPEQIRREREHALTMQIAEALNGETRDGRRLTKLDSAIAMIAAWRELTDLDRQPH